jgi:hypothetical protein
LSSYRGHIYLSQGIVLYFLVNALPVAKVQVPVLGPLALHFLRTDTRSILDSLDASQQNMFAKELSVTNTTFPNSTMFNDNFDFSRDYLNQFGKFIPFDFINQEDIFREQKTYLGVKLSMIMTAHSNQQTN